MTYGVNSTLIMYNFTFFQNHNLVYFFQNVSYYTKVLYSIFLLHTIHVVVCGCLGNLYFSNTFSDTKLFIH